MKHVSYTTLKTRFIKASLKMSYLSKQTGKSIVILLWISMVLGHLFVMRVAFLTWARYPSLSRRRLSKLLKGSCAQHCTLPCCRCHVCSFQLLRKRTSFSSFSSPRAAVRLTAAFLASKVSHQPDICSTVPVKGQNRHVNSFVVSFPWYQVHAHFCHSRMGQNYESKHKMSVGKRGHTPQNSFT